ncbi:MAG: class I tRNA ligase family protein [Proteobacteria bacterium]|nr:class I tRNA ligase family protein [Pseudomonadota bacterium]
MLIQKFDPAKFSEAYNIMCQGIYPTAFEGMFFPFGSTYCEVAPKGHSARHSHHENETFYILEGQGIIDIAGEKADVRAGDIVLIPAQNQHRLDNHSISIPLRFISIYWTAPLVSSLPKSLLVVPAPPTPNGPLHLGHLSGPYLAADVFCRYASLRGSKAAYALGTDDNQCYVLAKGRQLGLTGEQVAERFVPMITGALDRFGCKVHTTLHPLGLQSYITYVQRTFEDLLAKNALELRKVPTPYCLDTKQFLYGAQVSGGCPHCHHATNGNGCEACGYYNDCSDLLSPRSNVGTGPVELRDAQKYYFPLSRYAEKLRGLLARVAMHPQLRAYYEEYLSAGLPDVAVSQFGTWGVTCPGQPGQVLYEWFEMAGSYLYLADKAAQEQAGGDFWRGQSGGVVECFGFDNSFYYGLLLPALMLEIDPAVRPPLAFLSNYFYQLDGKKFSTSRNHAIWADTILAEMRPDTLRFYLSMTRAEDRETSFQLEDCTAFVRLELVGRWEGFLRRLDTALERSGRNVSAYAGTLSAAHERYIAKANLLLHDVHENYSVEHFSLNTVSELLGEYLALTARLFDRISSSSDHNSLNVVLQGLRPWSALLGPIMPDFSGQLLEAFGGGGSTFAVTANKTATSVGRLPLSELSDGLAELSAFQRKLHA